MTVNPDSSEILSALRGFPPRYFEQLVADVWQERQEWVTEVMNAGPDRGLDLIGEPPSGGAKTAVQCKRYKQGNKVTSDQIRQYASLRQQWDDVKRLIVVTTSSFTRDADELAKRLNVKCIDGDDLVQIVRRYDATEILDWYASGKPEMWWRRLMMTFGSGI
ncbi:MAG: restriction endonuclease [Haloarculaceae archaeon]